MITVMTQLLAKSESIIITVMSVMTQLLPTCWPSPNLEVNCASDLPLTRPGSSRLPVAIMSGTVTVPGPAGAPARLLVVGGADVGVRAAVEEGDAPQVVPVHLRRARAQMRARCVFAL